MNKREKLISLAIKEGKLALEGNEHKGGWKIEKYLRPFRELFIKNNPKYNDIKIGFDWCCCYVFYLLKSAGYKIEIQPFSDSTNHLGSVPAFVRWGQISNKFKLGTCGIIKGDIVIFKNLIDGGLDHIGIIVNVANDSIIVSEGNYYNRSGLFNRSLNNIYGYIRL